MINLTFATPLSENREQTILVPPARHKKAPPGLFDAAQQATAAFLQADRAEGQAGETASPRGCLSAGQPAGCRGLITNSDRALLGNHQRRSPWHFQERMPYGLFVPDVDAFGNLT